MSDTQRPLFPEAGALPIPVLALQSQPGWSITRLANTMSYHALSRNSLVIVFFNAVLVWCEPGDEPDIIESRYRDGVSLQRYSTLNLPPLGN